jgi:hypothetical protein
MGEVRKCTKFLPEYLTGRDLSGKTGVSTRIILKWMD